MTFYVRCPTCSSYLSENMEEFQKEMDAIGLSKKKREDKIKEISNLLDKFGYESLCCRMRVLCQLPYHKIIN